MGEMVGAAMNVAEIITDKRDGKTLEPERIEQLIAAYARDEVPDYQMSAFAMAVFFKGMEVDETVALTRAMLESGEKMKWSNNRTRVDKHSTGGIGDKISIPLAPLLAAADVDVPMISGRGLGLTGGTLDKLESIKGYQCELSNDEFRYVVNRCGCAIVSASNKIAVADKKLYALRDVTGTIPSIPLITASILSKKLSAGLDGLVLDVKWGSGAFMKTVDEARELAILLVDVANKFGVKTTALITDMNQPLGRMVGNSVEIDESLDVLKGEGPEDVVELVLTLGAEVLTSAGEADSVDDARVQLQDLLESGKALKKFEALVDAQKGMLSSGRRIAMEQPVVATEAGFVSRINSDRIGLAVVEMGGGRKQMGDQIDHSVGVELLVRLGDRVEKGQTIANVFCESSAKELAKELVLASIGIMPVESDLPKLIVETVRPIG